MTVFPKNKTSLRWLFTMAWRDSRRSRQKLLLFISSIVVGIAALVAISSFSENLQATVDEQAKELLGADYAVTSGSTPSAFTPDSATTHYTDEVAFASMVYFPNGGGSRLVNVKALGDGFPYYGAFETQPKQAGTEFRNERSALVDNTLLMQFNARPGDSIRIGEVTFLIKGNLEKVPGQNQVFSSVAPPVYIPLEYLEETNLLQKGSRYVWKRYVRILDLPANPQERAEILSSIEKDIPTRYENHSVETSESRKRSVGRIFDNLTVFLNLTAFMALLLGCVGVASSVNLYARSKLSAVAVLRCLGVSGTQAFAIFVLQIGTMGLLGAVVGAALGNALQWLLPEVFANILPVEVPISFSWRANLLGVGTGVLISVLFALLPLSKVRNVSPLRTLRASLEEEQTPTDHLPKLIYAAILLFIFGFTLLQMKEPVAALVFTAAILGAFGLLVGTAWGLVLLVKRFFPTSWSYLWRQGLANLFRPNNQTVTLMVSVGLGTALISTLLLSQNLLLQEVAISGADEARSNMVLFDIQTKQRDEVADLTRSFGLPLIQQVPIAAMRLEQIGEITAQQAAQDSTLRRYRGTFRREFRVSYRDSLIASEASVAGVWNGVHLAGTPVGVSLEERFAESIEASLGDTLVFNVQGMLLTAYVSHIRKVDWARVQTNFTILFPKGVLEDAPQFHVIMTRTENDGQSGKFQQALVEKYPNISVIDLNLILSTLDEVLTQISFVIQFMSLFSIITGFVVLIGSVSTSKYQRIQEAVLLRTLGGSRRQIIWISAIEYALLGSLATFTGLVLSLVGGWALATFSFQLSFAPPVWPLLGLWALVTLSTVGIGLLNSREVWSRPPLEVLRLEAA